MKIKEFPSRWRFARKNEKKQETSIYKPFKEEDINPEVIEAQEAKRKDWLGQTEYF